MFFMQAVQAPVIVRVDNRVFFVPKMTMDEMVEWGLHLVTQRFELNTANMDEGQKREYLTFYPIVPPNLQEMALHVRTVAGIQHVLTTCLSNKDVKGFMVDDKGKPDPKRPVPNLNEQEIAQLIASSGIGRGAALAWELADMRDVSKEDPGRKTPFPGSGEGDPLTSSEKAD